MGVGGNIGLVQLKLALNSSGDCWVFDLNNLLKDFGCSKPNSYAISLTESAEVESFPLACIINFS